jgi:hypothetical protein
MVKPTLLTPQEILGQSGHTFHSRVVKLLRQLGWSVLVSPYYSDNFTDKPREIDIIAEKAFRYENHMRGVFGEVVVRIFIECKYVTSTTVFWFDDKDAERAADRVGRDTGCPDQFIAHYFQRKHHHLSSRHAAKLFSSSPARGDDNEAIARAINQNLNALIYYRHRANVVHPRRDNAGMFGRMSFPIIVVDSFKHFHRTEMGDSSTVAPIVEPFQLEVNYAYREGEGNGRSEYFLIDVVSLDQLGAFLASLEATDVDAMLRYTVERADSR